jgi:hypothetical protein
MSLLEKKEDKRSRIMLNVKRSGRAFGRRKAK